MIFSNMLRESQYTNVLKVRKIVPVPKSMCSNRVENYRAIYLCPTIGKIFESIMFNQISEYLDGNNIVFERQYVFKKGAGTGEAVLNVVDFICGGFGEGYNGVAGVFFDLSKAFDLVDHNILIKKLPLYGFSPKSFEIGRNYLESRTQFVQIGETKSRYLYVLSVVPR